MVDGEGFDGPALVLHLKDIGLACRPFREMAGFTASVLEQECTLLRRLLAGEVRGGPLDWILINAGLLLYAGGNASSIAAGYFLGKKAVDSGAAAKKIKVLTGGGSVGAAKPMESASSVPVPSGVVS